MEDEKQLEEMVDRNDGGSMALMVVGYILAIIVPLLGLLFAGVVYFSKNDVEFYNRHSKYIASVAIFVWIISSVIMSFL